MPTMRRDAVTTQIEVCDMNVRDAVIDSYSLGNWTFTEFLTKSRTKEAKRRGLYHAWLCLYYQAFCYGRTARGAKPVEVDTMVEKWMDVVVKLGTAHDKDEFDSTEAKLDTILMPMLKCPIKQLREFYHKLVAAMKKDPKVPMLIWSMFEAWGKIVVDKASDEGVKRLKTKLAREIADLVEPDIQPQIGEAIVRALRWRSGEQLEAVKTQLKAGHKPRLRGRESCLFLAVGRGKHKAEVML